MSNFAQSYGALGVYVALMLEGIAGVGLFVPGVTVLVAAGFLSATGTLSLSATVAAAWAGVLSGDMIGYLTGRLAQQGRRIGATVEAVEARIGREPRWFWVFFHFPVITRPTVPLLAGGMKMPLTKWLPISTAASALFVTVVGGCGWIAGRAAGGKDAADHASELIQAAALVGVIGIALILVARARRGRR